MNNYPFIRAFYVQETFSNILKLVFWGFTFGTTEDLVYVLKGGVENYKSLFGNPDFAEANPIGSGPTRCLYLRMSLDHLSLFFFMLPNALSHIDGSRIVQ